MFMDYFVVGVEDDNGAISIYYEFSALMKTIKLSMGHKLRKLRGIWKAEGQKFQRTKQALGVDWNTESDTL